ncbi:MAG: hypothetical protein SCAL_000088 [Candidatus Syntrophoarchaeum caldarius]|uniref:Uncharacterized protein n=1 Tax=Candidatus Syntropharchaeum caldarium TaxID=1838285 RepID=A0A1F2PBZ0_9EURY|nr:MAG: hypothetical protein SCAL_000088 [Candidatus Syntrophoarchaeum caldarius]
MEEKERDVIPVEGDTNTVLGCAFAASKLGIGGWACGSGAAELRQKYA